MPSQVECICIDPKTVSATWPNVSHFIKAAMDRGPDSFDDLQADVLSGVALLWVALDTREILAAAVTQLTVTRGVKVCTIVACGGSGLDRFGLLIGRLENYARDEGCKLTRICGRGGWARVFPEYRVISTIIEKELT